MSTETDKFKRSKRLQNDENAIRKQVKIAKQHNVKNYQSPAEKEPNRFNKHHAMDCGNPECFVCGNPRKTHKDKLTAQEHRLYQDLDQTRDKRSNGVPAKEEND